MTWTIPLVTIIPMQLTKCLLILWVQSLWGLPVGFSFESDRSASLEQAQSFIPSTMCPCYSVSMVCKEFIIPKAISEVTKVRDLY